MQGMRETKRGGRGSSGGGGYGNGGGKCWHNAMKSWNASPMATLRRRPNSSSWYINVWCYSTSTSPKAASSIRPGII